LAILFLSVSKIDVNRSYTLEYVIHDQNFSHNSSNIEQRSDSIIRGIAHFLEYTKNRFGFQKLSKYQWSVINFLLIWELPGITIPLQYDKAALEYYRNELQKLLLLYKIKPAHPKSSLIFLW
jgi:hypothetical protein